MSRHRVKCLMLTYSPCVYRVLTVNLPPRLSHRVGECRSFLLPLLSLNVTESRGYMASNLFRTRSLHHTYLAPHHFIHRSADLTSFSKLSQSSEA